MNYAITDLGSNTIRLSVYQTQPGGDFERLFSEKEMAGLANYINGGVLSQEGMERACQALLHFKRLLHQFGMEEMHVFATASLRNIRNTAEAVEAIRRVTGLEIDVVSGDLEAQLGYLGAMKTTDLQSGAMFDIGGGSTELVEVRDGQILRAQSLPLGSLNLFNRHVSKIWPKRKELEAIQDTIREALALADLPKEKAAQVCGVGGTARAVLKIANAWYGRLSLDRCLTPDELDELTELLLNRDHVARKLILNACPDRVHTILPGILLMNAVCGALCNGDIYISKYGVREGYLCHKFLANET